MTETSRRELKLKSDLFGRINQAIAVFESVRQMALYSLPALERAIEKQRRERC
jgi:hypothetical protein